MKIISNIDSKLTLDFILNNSESVIFERKWVFKPDWTIWFKATKVANQIIWMLNADGWVLVIWVNDWEIQDLNKLNNIQLNDYIQVVLEFILPPALVEVEKVDIEWKLIIIYHIKSDKERIFCRKDNEKVFLRNWDETIELNRDWVRKLEYDKTIRKFEEEKREDFLEEDFNIEIIENYKNKINFSWSHKDLLVNRNLATKENWNYIYKNSAILLFSNNPEKYISSASVRYVRYEWNKQTSGVNFNVIKDERFEECIPKNIELIKTFLKNVLKDYYYLDLETWKFVKISEYPEDAWLEWLINALTHRSYNLQWNVIYIKHFNDRIEISNSWPLPSIVTIENIKETRFSRNPKVARVLSEMWYVRELSEWVSRIYDSMKKSFLSEPEFTDKNDIVTLILKNKVSKSDDTISEKTMKKIEEIFEKLNKTEKWLLNYLILNKIWTKKEISKNIWVWERTVRRYLNKLIGLNILINKSDKKRWNDIIFSINNS